MNKTLEKPILLSPIYRSSLWGGQRIAKHYNRKGTPSVCSESWEISGHPDGSTVISNGEHKGKKLNDLTKEFGTALVGTLAPNPKHFPLLFKLLDAQRNLSVQIHPNVQNASLTHGEPKEEMWYVLECKPGASLYAGFKSGTTEPILRKALEQGTIDSKIIQIPVDLNDILYIPGGLVHSIGAGCLIYEVQQSSNTTYRFFDWNRLDADGKPRQLHLEESFKSIDWSLAAPKTKRPILLKEKAENRLFEVLSSPYFHMKKLDLGASTTVHTDGITFYVFFVKSGSISLTSGGETVFLNIGDSALIPADAPSYQLSPLGGKAEILITTL